MDYQAPPPIPMSSPDLTDLERQAVLSVVSTPHLSMGPYIHAFEQAFRDRLGCRHALAVSSGTTGLHLVVITCGIQEGDLVITTPFSFVASTNVILYERAIPIFVDVEPLTGNLDCDQVSQAAADLTRGGLSARRWLPRRGAQAHANLKAVLAVDVFSQPADFDRLRPVSDAHGLKLIEDSCEALGAEYKGRKAGSLGDFGVFGFYPNKQVATGEGGMIITDDDQAAQLMNALRNQGRAPGDTWLQHTHLGYNYRLDEMSAAMGAAQMTRLEALLEARQRVVDWYQQRLAGIQQIELPQLAPETSRPSWFVYVIRLARGVDRAGFAERLAKRGVPVRPYFLPIHLQPYMMKRFGYQKGDFPITEDLGERGLALPFSGCMTEDQVDQVCAALKAALA